MPTLATDVVKHVRLDRRLYRYGSYGEITPILSVTTLTNPCLSLKYHLPPYTKPFSKVKLAIGDELSISSNYSGTVSSIEVLNRGTDVESDLYPSVCPVCGTPLIYSHPKYFVDVFQHNTLGVYGGVCLARDCKAQVSLSLSAFSAVFQMYFNNTNYRIFSHLLATGALSSIMDLIYIDMETILKLENIMITRDNASEFMSFINSHKKNASLLNILIGFKLPNVSRSFIEMLGAMTDYNEFLDTIDKGNLSSVYDEKNELTEVNYDRVSAFFDIAPNRTILEKLIQWSVL